MTYLLIGLLIVSIIGNITLGIIIRRALDVHDRYELYFLRLQGQLAAVFAAIRSIDLRGAFEADDEVGAVFNGIKDCIYTLQDFRIENYGKIAKGGNEKET